ncbi:hypothetical protein [Methanospirillum sp.]|uniref:hypothetical protein n=1 Tax=Methanospirillum sp. TaxID=45200 RepID=UPI0035A0CDA2
MHTLVDKDFLFIREIATTTASLHDSKIDLTKPGQTVYRDKGYFGVKPEASMDKTIHRVTRNHPLSCKKTPKQSNFKSSFSCRITLCCYETNFSRVDMFW